MLAASGKDIAPTAEGVIAALGKRNYIFEFKFDGVRALVHLAGGTVKITNRRSVDITYRYPDVVAALTGAVRDVVLDGELVVLDSAGRSDFTGIHRRDAQGSTAAAKALATTLPVTFVAFDILEHDGADLRLLSYLNRRTVLESASAGLGGMAVSPMIQDGALAWQVVREMHLEGLVAKAPDAAYVGKRSGKWVKIKDVRRVSVMVAGFDVGLGSRAATFGALWMSLVKDGELVPIGRVGSGFTDADIALIWGRLQAGDHPIVIDVEFLNVSPDGQLRQPVFKGVRLDVPVTDCTTDQLH